MLWAHRVRPRDMHSSPQLPGSVSLTEPPKEDAPRPPRGRSSRLATSRTPPRTSGRTSPSTNSSPASPVSNEIPQVEVRREQTIGGSALQWAVESLRGPAFATLASRSPPQCRQVEDEPGVKAQTAGQTGQPPAWPCSKMATRQQDCHSIRHEEQRRGVNCRPCRAIHTEATRCNIQ